MRRFTSELVRDPDFAKLWAGQTISELGSRITRDGLPLVAVFVLSATPSQMGLLAAIGSLPILLMGWIAGVWVDRLERRPIMIIADVGRAALLATIPIAALLGWLTLGQLYVVLVLTSTLTVFFDVAYLAYLPSLVERERLVESNSRLAASGALAEIGGPSLTGFLVQALTAPVAIFFDALSFVVSVVTLALIRTPEPRVVRSGATRNAFSEAQAGLAMVWDNGLLRAFLLGGGTRAFFGNFFGALYVLYAIRELGLSAAALGITIAMGGLGDMTGALLARRIALRAGLGPTLIGTLTLGSLAAFLIPLASGPVLVATLFMMAAQWLGDMLETVCAIYETSVRQGITPEGWLGRGNATMHMVIEGLGPLGALVGGVLGEWIGLRATLVIACLGSLVGVLWLWMSPVRTLREMPAAFTSAEISRAAPTDKAPPTCRDDSPFHP